MMRHNFSVLNFALWLGASAATVYPSTAATQTLDLGVIGGAAFSTLQGFREAVDDPTLQTSRRAGVTIGTFALLPVRGSWTIETGALFARRGIDLRGGQGQFPGGASIELNVIDFPLLVTWRQRSPNPIRWHVLGGPVVSWRRLARFGATDGPVISIDDLVRGGEIGVAAGVRVSVDPGLSFEVRWSHGLTNLLFPTRSDLISGTLRHDAIYLLAGYRVCLICG